MALFNTLVKENKERDENRPDTREYEEFSLNDLDEGLIFEGQPYLTKIYENEFDGVKKYSANLYINNHENEEKIKARINLKSLNDEISVWQGSVAYDIIDSLEALEDPENAGVNNVYTMSFKELQTHLNSLNNVEAEVKSHTGDFNYNTMRIIAVEE